MTVASSNCGWLTHRVTSSFQLNPPARRASVSSARTAGASRATLRLAHNEQVEGYDDKGDQVAAKGDVPAVRQVGGYRVEIDPVAHVFSSDGMDEIKAVQ
jgi:hypothetical protein